ncbi:AAA family ATPase [Proteobacteria bacterium 005FR1]|nr:AAA family ATPase [Proteobacteria bacterium 005FR1]
MYKDFYRFDELPFTLTPNTQFFFNQQSHREALNTMLLALRHSEGFIKIVGEVGTGKTLLCRKLLSLLDGHFITIYIPNPYLTPEELKGFIAEELGIKPEQSIPSYELLSIIYRHLIKLAEQGKQVVLVIDEAQAMPRETIESLRLLTNLETERRKLLQVVLLGQPELDVLLNRSDLRQLKQRIVFSERLRPFSVSGTAHYVRHRLLAAGCKAELFTPGALRLLALASGGTPRLINILAHKSLLAAYGRSEPQVKAKHVARAMADTEESRWQGKLFAWRWRLLAPLAVTVGAAFVLQDFLRGLL